MNIKTTFYEELMKSGKSMAKNTVFLTDDEYIVIWTFLSQMVKYIIELKKT